LIEKAKRPTRDKKTAPASDAGADAVPTMGSA